MDLVRLFIKQISYSQSQNEAFVLILQELESELKLPIVIGAFEAQAIALELEKDLIPAPPRPLTHDLFKNFARVFGVNVTKVVINKLTEGVFHSYLFCEQNGVEHTIDARTSDAIAIALRFKAPIYTHKHILQRAGFQIPNTSKSIQTTISPTLEFANEPETKEEKSRLSRHSLIELQKMLDDCIENEDYELAAQIRDEITKRNNL